MSFSLYDLQKRQGYLRPLIVPDIRLVPSVDKTMPGTSGKLDGCERAQNVPDVSVSLHHVCKFSDIVGVCALVIFSIIVRRPVKTQPIALL